MRKNVISSNSGSCKFFVSPKYLLALKYYSELVNSHNVNNPENLLKIKYCNNIPTVIDSEEKVIYPNSIYAPVPRKKRSQSTSTPISKNSTQSNGPKKK